MKQWIALDSLALGYAYKGQLQRAAQHMTYTGAFLFFAHTDTDKGRKHTPTHTHSQIQIKPPTGNYKTHARILTQTTHQLFTSSIPKTQSYVSVASGDTDLTLFAEDTTVISTVTQQNICLKIPTLTLLEQSTVLLKCSYVASCIFHNTWHIMCQINRHD